MKKLFTIQELKFIKYKLMKNQRYTEKKAEEEIKEMIETVRGNHKKMKKRRKKEKNKFVLPSQTINSLGNVV